MSDNDDVRPRRVKRAPDAGPLEREKFNALIRGARLRERTDEDGEDGGGDEVEPPAGQGENPFTTDDDDAEPPANRLAAWEEYRDRQRGEIERAEIERAEAERAEVERAEVERAEAERAEAERAEAERAERDVESFDAPPPEPPGIGTNNWTPIGPSVVRRGQSSNRPAVSGRIPAVAVGPGGTRVYAATAVGGVFRSDDGGVSWRSMMEAFDLNPTNPGSASLACGAIALDPTDVNRLFVGTGENFTRYFGVGPVRSDDGGATWVVEPVAAGSPRLAGQGFFELAMDPGNTARLVGATTAGLYRREPSGGGFAWVQRRAGQHSSVVVARTGTTTTFFAAQYRGGIFSSADGGTWTALGTGFPTVDVGRIALAVRPADPSVVYALVERFSDSRLHGLYRYDAATTQWRQVAGVPAALLDSTGGQGWYDICLTIAPNDVNLVYVGGATALSGGNWCGSIYRCPVTSSGAGAALTYATTPTFIGARTHADVHALVFTPGSPTELWAATDGGLFRTADAPGTAVFESRNTGLMTITVNYVAQHPSEDAVLFAGTQDNGTVRYTGEECWLHSAAGDGGFAVVSWNDPYRVLRTYVRGFIDRATDGGQTYASWADVSIPVPNEAVFYAPLVGTPRSATPADADVVAFGGRRPWISTTFGGGWVSIPANDATDNLPNNHSVLSMAFASATRLYVGTDGGRVYRYDRAGGTWTRTQISAAPLLVGPITDVVVDLADATGNSVYVTLGGTGDARHVWHWNGTAWTARSGAGTTGLLDVVHNALVVDPSNTGTLYVGADIGVWRSTDSGATWATLSLGLPDAPVLDLALHATRRLLWAATHGRGVFELALDTASSRAVELYVRDTQLDRGRRPTANGLPDPTEPGRTVWHWRGPDIKVDAPMPDGTYQTPSAAIDFFQFTDVILDESEATATAAATTPVTNRVFVQVHNRGRRDAGTVQVMLLIANASMGLPSLPAGYDADVRAGNPITTPAWRTVGFRTLTNVRAGYPRIASFDLPSSLLPPPASLAGNRHHCLLALLHCPGDDEFVNSQVVVDVLSPNERKSAHKNLNVVAITPTGGGPVAWQAIDLNSFGEGSEQRHHVHVHPRRYPGRILVVPPVGVNFGLEGFEKTESSSFEESFERTVEALYRGAEEGAFDREWAERRVGALEAGLRTGVFAVGSRKLATITDVFLNEGDSTTMFFALEPPEGATIGETYEVRFEQLVDDRDQRGPVVTGGSTYRVVVHPGPDTLEDGFTVKAWGDLLVDGELLKVAVWTDRGQELQGHHAEVTFHPVSPAGLDPTAWRLDYDDTHGAFVLRVEGLPHASLHVVRGIVVAHVKDIQVRRTITVEFI